MITSQDILFAYRAHLMQSLGFRRLLENQTTNEHLAKHFCAVIAFAAKQTFPIARLIESKTRIEYFAGHFCSLIVLTSIASLVRCST